MFQRLYLLTIIFSGATVLCAPAQDNGTLLTLKQAYQRAIEFNPSLKQTKEVVNQAETEIPLAWANVMPTVSATGLGEKAKNSTSGGSANNSAGDKPYNLYQAGLHASQPLFAYGVISGIESARKDKLMKEYNVAIAQRSLGTNVISDYFQVALDMKNVDTLVRQEKVVRESMNVTEHRYHTGRSQLLDVLQAKTQVASLVSQVADAKYAVEIAAANLANLLGEPHAKAYAVKDKMEAPSVDDISKHVDNSRIASLPEVEQNKVLIEQVDDLKAVTWGQNLPTVNVVGDYAYNSLHANTLVNGNSNSWDIGIGVTVPLFSGLSGLNKQYAYDSQKIQYENQQRSIENAANLNLVVDRKQLETAQQGVISGTETWKLAVESSKEAIRQYKLATIDFLQFLTIQQALVAAEQTLNNYKYNYIVALGNYYAASNQDLSHLVDLLEAAN